MCGASRPRQQAMLLIPGYPHDYSTEPRAALTACHCRKCPPSPSRGAKPGTCPARPQMLASSHAPECPAQQLFRVLELTHFCRQQAGHQAAIPSVAAEDTHEACSRHRCRRGHVLSRFATQRPRAGPADATQQPTEHSCSWSAGDLSSIGQLVQGRHLLRRHSRQH